MVEIEDDRETLKRVIAKLGLRPSRPKEAAAWVIEKVGRLKLNGQLRGYSPLSRVLELESLTVGIAGKEALWRALQRVGAVDTVDLERLIERARRQRAEAEEQRVAALDEAFR